MGLFKRNRTWFIDYYYPPGREGKRIREKVGPSKDEARIVLAERLKDIRQGKNPEIRMVKPKPFAEAADEFIASHVAGCRNRRSYEVKVNVLKRHFCEMTLQEITPKVIDTWISDRLAAGTAKATANRYRAVLSKLFNWAIAHDYYGGENPTKRVKRFAESPGRVRYLTADEAGKLTEAAPKHLRPVIVTALHTGGRLGEILSLRRDDVDLDRGVLYFNAINTKSGKQRELPIDAELRPVLADCLKVRSIGGDGREFIFTRHGKRLRDVRTAFDRARTGAGLGEDVTFHVLRHTFASWFMMNGGDLYRLQKYLGHSTITLTQRYAHLSPKHLRDGVQYFGPPAEVRSHVVDTNAGPVG